MATCQKTSSTSVNNISGPIPTPFPSTSTIDKSRLRKLSTAASKKSSSSLKENLKPYLQPSPSVASLPNHYADSIDERTPLLPGVEKSKSGKVKSGKLTQEQMEKMINKAFAEGGIDKARKVKELLEKDMKIDSELSSMGF